MMAMEFLKINRWKWFSCFCFISCIYFTNVLSEKYERCLTEAPKTPPIYPYFSEHPVTIILDTSSRISHQLSTHVFRIFLQEVLNYPRVEVVFHEDNFNISNVTDRLEGTLNIEFPIATINLETWIPPGYDAAKKLMHFEVEDSGNAVSPGGRFGWYIPIELDQPIKKFYKEFNRDIREIPWYLFRDPEVASQFDLDYKGMSIVHELSSGDIKNTKMTCEANCTDGTYVPQQCKGGKKCALLLTSRYNSTKFVIDHINELKLQVKVMWLEEHLWKVVQELKKEYKVTNSKKSLLILSWSPSLLIPDENDFFSVDLKKCELLHYEEEEGCKYEMNRLAKFSWKKLKKFAEPIYEALHEYAFNVREYSKLLKLYINRTNAAQEDHEEIVQKVACEWMLLSKFKWEKWIGGSTETVLIIGGIFPVTNSLYAGDAIAWGALMAQHAVNDNKTLLKDYTLKVIVSNGQCKPDIVLRCFIDYVNYPDKLIGVLGPACSDTVEPLASVSKQFKTMIISYSAEGASFSDRVKYPYFFRTIGENKHYLHVYLQLLKIMKWKQVAAITEDGQKFTEYISQMQTLLQDNHIHFVVNIKFPRDRKDVTLIKYLEELKKKHARIIIADVLGEVARSLMCEAYKQKMTAKQGYVWFLPTLNTTWYHTDKFNFVENENVNCTRAEMIEAITGHFSIAHAYFAADDAIIQTNITVAEWKKQYNKKANQPSDYAGYAFDAVWTYALAVDKLAKADPEFIYDMQSPENIHKMVEVVKATDFNGVSGRIKFRGGPSRFSVINVMEWYDNVTHIIGKFMPNLTDDKPEILGGRLVMNDSAIRWFTPNHERPNDGIQPPEGCALEGFARFFNVECSMAIIILNIIVVSTFILLVGAVIYKIKKRYDKKVQDTKDYIESIGYPVLQINRDLAGLDKLEVPREAVVINRKLGEGAFGTVYGGEANFNQAGWLPVAVKTLKMGSSPEEKLDFLTEANVMKNFKHANIVKLLGVVVKQEPLYTIMEFMLYGDLKTFLLARRHLANSKNAADAEEVSSKRLTAMALDVARGLSYLADLNYVHRDLASRNCLINASKNVKLGDFGMTRPTSVNGDYQFNRKGMLPVRWMSPESLDLGIFNTASDVWSYGVLLFEIVTFGSFPFQGFNNVEVLEYVKNGHTLDIPRGVKPQLEALLKSCWDQNYKNRPAAKEIAAFIAEHPTLLSACLDVPLASVQFENSDELEVHIRDQFRKCSTPTTKSPPPLMNGISSLSFDSDMKIMRQLSVPDANVNIPLDNYCPKEPLLGPTPARSTSSLINLGKYLTVQHKDEENYVPSSNNGHVMSRM